MLSSSEGEMAYRMLGIDDAVNVCDCCGKKNLKCTVALESLETFEIVRYGRDCAGKALGHKGGPGLANRIESAARTASLKAIEAELRERGLYGIGRVTDAHRAQGVEEVMVGRTVWGKRWTLRDGRTYVEMSLSVGSAGSMAKVIPGTWSMLCHSHFIGQPA